MTPEAVLTFVSTAVNVLKFVAVCSLLTGVICEIALKAMIAWVRKRYWWPRAAPLQKALMMNFGFPEASCTDEATLACYAYVIVLCTHHFICGSLMVPVVMYGWNGAQALGQACFVVGALMDVSVDVYDEFRMFTTTFLYESVGKKLFGGEKSPKEFFIVLGVLHHPLALSMVCPLVLYHPDLAGFHIIAIALLLAAGICFTTGSYKFTLDMTKKCDWYQFKFIVLVQTVTILYTRGYIWFYQVYLVLTGFWATDDMHFFFGGCFAATLMSLFNLVMIADSVGAAVKWLPRGMVKEGSKELEELKVDLIKSVPPTQAKGAMKGSLIASTVLGLTPEQTFRTDVKVVIAAAKFKRGLRKAQERKEDEKTKPLLAN